MQWPSIQQVYTHAINIIDRLTLKYNVDLLNIVSSNNIINSNNGVFYHNITHAFSTLYFTHLYYRYYYKKLKHINKDALLIAALLHDLRYNTIYNNGADFINILNTKITINAIDELDALLKYEICSFIEYTEYPWPKGKRICRKDKLIFKIIRAADLSQIFICDEEPFDMFYNLHIKEKNGKFTSIFNLCISNYRFYKNACKDNKVFRKFWNMFERSI